MNINAFWNWLRPTVGHRDSSITLRTKVSRMWIAAQVGFRSLSVNQTATTMNQFVHKLPPMKLFQIASCLRLWGGISSLIYPPPLARVPLLSRLRRRLRRQRGTVSRWLRGATVFRRLDLRKLSDICLFGVHSLPPYNIITL